MENNKEKITIVSYTSKYKEAFKTLNLEWISNYFKIESSDNTILNFPEENIITKGGCIFIALLNQTPVGVCALVKLENDEFDYELAKMAVSPNAQGKGIGFKLGVAIIEKAKQLGGKTVYLESNRKLVPAIHLYEKLGFVKIKNRSTPYERCDIQMMIDL